MMSGLAVRQCVVLLKTFRVLCVVGKNKMESLCQNSPL
jgi:hypothetical protein